MKIKLLFKALKFACLPTLSILILLFCGFFSITKAITWISSNEGLAIFLRVAMVIAEVILVSIMYLQYAKEDAIKNSEEYIGNPRFDTCDSDRSIGRIYGETHNDARFKVYSTGHRNIKVIEYYNKA